MQLRNTIAEEIEEGSLRVTKLNIAKLVRKVLAKLKRDKR